MKKPKYTAGPWELTIGTNTCAVKQHGALGYICTMSEYCDDKKPNARLIAAAPDLLEALEDFLSVAESLEFDLDDDGNAQHWIIKAKNAIERAKGAAEPRRARDGKFEASPNHGDDRMIPCRKHNKAGEHGCDE